MGCYSKCADLLFLLAAFARNDSWCTGSPALLAPAFRFELADEVADPGGFLRVRLRACALGSRVIAGDACIISARSSALRALTLGSKSATPATWMNSFLRLLEARDRIVLPGRLTFSALLLSTQAAAFAPDAGRCTDVLAPRLGRARPPCRSAEYSRGWSPWAVRGQPSSRRSGPEPRR